ILLNAVLFIRPAEIVPDLEAWPIYEVVILACLLVSLPSVVRQLEPAELAANPITACVLGLLVAVVLSHLSHFFLWGVRESSNLFVKVVLYYLLVVSTLNTLSRLRQFLFWLVVFITVLTVLAVCQYHGVVDIPALSAFNQLEYDPETGEQIILPRLRSTGIYNDPNDLSLILVVGILLCLAGLGGNSGVLRFAWVGPLALFGYALTLTYSRGGMLSLLAGLVALFQARFGWRKSILLSVAVLPVLLLGVGGRQADLATSEGTGQARIQLWSEGL